MYARTILHGYLGADAEIVTVGSNGAQCMRLSVATSTRWKNKESNEYEERTTWHRVVVWGERLIQGTAPYAKKGALVFVEGVPEVREWKDRDGNRREAHEVVVSQVGVLRIPPPPRAGYGDRGSEPAARGRSETRRTPPPRPTGQGATSRRPAPSRSLADEAEGDGGAPFEDDIPF